jgi:RimJ/RimL family protein N-acetyltransferase
MTALPEGYEIDAMTRAEADVLESWAAAEQWNPGLADMGIAWDFDAEAFIALRKDGELVGGGTILSYDGRAGFMGLFIMRPDHRRRGLGTVLWHERLRRLRARLLLDAPIAMDGVFDMAPFYARGGFQLQYRDLRYQGVVSAEPHPDAVPLAQVPFEQVDAYDRGVFGTPRTEFLHAWLSQPAGTGVAVLDAGELRGYGFLRPCRVGFKLGPVFADDPEAADVLLQDLFAAAGRQRVQLDVPEPNAPAIALAQRYGLEPGFSCARMVHGTPLPMPLDRIFGVTSFEFG